MTNLPQTAATPEIKLPISALEQTDACFLDRRTADFTARHGHPPGETSTWAEWCAVLPSIAHRLWTVARVLPLVRPAQQGALLRVVVEVVCRAAVRAQPADPDPRAAEALVQIRQWLDGAAISPASVLKTLYGFAPSAYSAYAVGYLVLAASAVEAAEAADNADAVGVAATNAAVWGAEAAYRCTRYVAADEGAERAQQAKDLDELLHALVGLGPTRAALFALGVEVTGE